MRILGLRAGVPAFWHNFLQCTFKTGHLLSVFLLLPSTGHGDGPSVGRAGRREGMIFGGISGDRRGRGDNMAGAHGWSRWRRRRNAPSPSAAARPPSSSSPPPSPLSACPSTVHSLLGEDDHFFSCDASRLHACPPGAAIPHAVPRARGMTRSPYHGTPISPCWRSFRMA